MALQLESTETLMLSIPEIFFQSNKMVIPPCKISLSNLSMQMYVKILFIASCGLVFYCIKNKEQQSKRLVQQLTLPAASAEKAVEALDSYAVWHLDAFLQRKRPGFELHPCLLLRRKNLHDCLTLRINYQQG